MSTVCGKGSGTLDPSVTIGKNPFVKFPCGNELKDRKGTHSSEGNLCRGFGNKLKIAEWVKQANGAKKQNKKTNPEKEGKTELLGILNKGFEEQWNSVFLAIMEANSVSLLHLENKIFHPFPFVRENYSPILISGCHFGPLYFHFHL